MTEPGALIQHKSNSRMILWWSVVIVSTILGTIFAAGVLPHDLGRNTATLWTIFLIFVTIDAFALMRLYKNRRQPQQLKGQGEGLRRKGTGKYTGIVRDLGQSDESQEYGLMLERYDENTKEQLESIPVKLTYQTNTESQIVDGDVVEISGNWEEGEIFSAAKIYDHTKKLEIQLRQSNG